MKSESITFSDGKYSGSGEKLQPFKLKMITLVNENVRGRILDIGCGSGAVSQKLHEAGWKVCGMDVSYEGICKYSGRGFAGLISDAERGLPFKEEVFDAVWISEVIEHLVDCRTLFQEIRRVLKSSGRVYLTVPNSVFYGYRLLYLLGRCPSELQHPFHVRFFSPGFLARVLVEQGFETGKCIGQNVYLMIPGAFVRWGERVAPKLTQKLLTFMRISKVEGLIHGDKYLLYRFSSFYPAFFSNAIMMVAAKK